MLTLVLIVVILSAVFNGPRHHCGFGPFMGGWMGGHHHGWHHGPMDCHRPPMGGWGCGPMHHHHDFF